MIDWIRSHETVLWWLAALSAILFIVTAMAVPMLLGRIRADYFARSRHPGKPWADLHPVVRAVLLTGKTALGLALVVAGMAMLVLPGQGILTILAGILLLNFPGRYRLERWIVSRPPVLRSINWLRRRNGRPPLVPED
jgi:hypothetical protein